MTEHATRGASPQGEAPSLSGTLWTYIQCPHCRTWMGSPFARMRVPVTNTHRTVADPHGRRCRVIVVPDPAGTAHEVHLVPAGERYEDAMQRILMELLRTSAA